MEAGCERDADFFVYEAPSEGWSAVCTPHVRHRHASLELQAWLESGYLKPAELGRPDGPPPPPPTERGRLFRNEVEETMGWSG